jgi:CBS domain-containing protein
MIQDVTSFLKDHYPFSGLPGSALEALSFHITVRYYPEGEVIFKEGTKPLEHLFLIRKGEVSLEVGGAEVDLLHEGDTFGYPSLLSGDPPTSTAIAVSETILYLIPKEIFLRLIEKYEEFELFFAKSLAKKLSATARFLRYPEAPSSLEKFMTLRIKDIRYSPALFLKESDNVLKASRLMREKNITCVFVGGKDTGIVTERDIIKKVVAEGRDPFSVKLREIMSSPVISLEEEDFVFDAILAMTRHNIRRVGVKRGGEIRGVLEDKDLLVAESRNLLVILKEIERAGNVQDLRYIYSLVQELVSNLLKEGLDVLQIGRLISDLSDRFISKAVFLVIKKMGKEPPVNFSVMVLGSEGRREQTLKTDQDNALIYDDTIPSLDEDPDEYFTLFSRELSELLTRIGFPPCPGKVMVSNPEWRHGRQKWMRIISNWLSRPEPENTLKFGMFFDFRNAFGDEKLTEELRDFILNEAKEKELFLSYMLLDAVRFKPPLGLFNRLLTEKAGPKKGEIDIKKGGIFPITQGIRALALRAGIRETPTIERLSRLTELGEIPPDLGADLREAFLYLQTVRLRAQLSKIKEGKEPDNHISPSSLGKLERDLLKDSLKIVKEFQEFIERHYTQHLPR